MRKVLLFFMLFLMCGPLFAQNEITWFGDVMEIPGPAKYARMVLMKQGPPTDPGSFLNNSYLLSFFCYFCHFSY